MVDKISSAKRSKNMAAIRAKNTKPEIVVRRLVHEMGYRFRLHRRDLPGCPDLVFVNKKKVIFVHGCFWHLHPDTNCKDSRLPKSKRDYWGPKLMGNQKRDEAALKCLKKTGWKVLVIWECQIKKPPDLLSRLRRFLRDGN